MRHLILTTAFLSLMTTGAIAGEQPSDLDPLTPDMISRQSVNGCAGLTVVLLSKYSNDMKDTQSYMSAFATLSREAVRMNAVGNDDIEEDTLAAQTAINQATKNLASMTDTSTLAWTARKCLQLAEHFRNNPPATSSKEE